MTSIQRPSSERSLIVTVDGPAGSGKTHLLGQVRDETIDIPAGEQATEWSRCVFNEDVDVIFLASHTHALATNFTIRPFDGSFT